MVAIRLSRTGAKKRPSYRVVVIDSRRARDSRNIEIVGHYNPRPDPIEVVLKRDRIDYWVSVGAQMSDTVRRLVRHFDERIVDEAGNGAPAQVPAVDEAPEPAAPSASAPGAPVPVAPGEQVEEDTDEVEALLEFEGAAGPSAEPPAEEEPAAIADAAETAAVEEAGEPAPERPEALSVEPEADAQAVPAPVAEAESGGKADSAPAAEPEAAVDAEPAAAREPEADAEAAPAVAAEPAADAEAAQGEAPEPTADTPGESAAADDDSEPHSAEAKPE